MRATRCVWRWSTSRSSRTCSGSPSPSISMTSMREDMIPIGLLSSCASPAESVPSAASFSVRRAASASAARSASSR